MTKYFGDFWTNIYGYKEPQASFIEALQRCYNNQEIQSASYVKHINKALSRHTVDKAVPIKNRLVVYNESQLNDQHYIFDGTLTFDGSAFFNSKMTSVFRMAVPKDIIEPAFIADDPADPKIILQNGIDFIYNDGFIYMNEDIRSKNFKVGFDESFPPQQTLSLWFLNCGGFYNTIQRLYGDTIQAASFSNREIINIYWDMLIEGCSSKNLRRLLCAITDTDYLGVTGTVQEIFTENNRICAYIEDNLYTAPEAAGILVSVGDTVEEGQLIFGNAVIYEKDDTIPDGLFPIMHLSEAMVGADIAGGVSISNQSSDIPGLRETLLMENVSLDAVEALISGDPAYLVSTSGGYELIQYATEPYTELKMVRILEALPFRGTDENVLAFLNKLNSLAIQNNKTILDILIDSRDGSVPDTLNLFDQYRKNLFGTNATFISIKTELAPSDINPSACLAFLKRVLNAGTALLTFFASESIVEYSLDAVLDSVSTFIVPDTLAEVFDSVTDTVKAG